MRDRKEYFQHILLFCYRDGKNAVQIRKKLRKVYGESVYNDKLVSKLIFKFQR